MNDEALKIAVRDRLLHAVAGLDAVRSATLTGSFLDAPSLEGISDIDFVVVVEPLHAAHDQQLRDACDAVLRPLLAEAGYDLLIHSALGPLKFNAPRLAVLHLMVYSHSGHVEHVLHSPFTCLDWQRSATWGKRSLAEVYPVFALQPRHFLGARRGLGDYLNDLRAGVISYREPRFTEAGCEEVKQAKPMTPRDRHEFAYHVQRFLMSNLVKLVTRRNERPATAELLASYFAIFAEGADRFAPFFHDLEARKKSLDFSSDAADLLPTLEAFVAAFERQFRAVFFDTATRHVVFRHAPTRLNQGSERIFQGSLDEDILSVDPAACTDLLAAVNEVSPTAAFTSPLRRARQSLEYLGLMLPTHTDVRLREIEYGELEGLSVSAARVRFADVFDEWRRGNDPSLPGGENTAAVLSRALRFTASWRTATAPTLTCTHNVVLRCLLGHTLGVPRRDWHRLEVPHLAPITFVQTRNHGLFVDLPISVQRHLFADWARPTEG